MPQEPDTYAPDTEVYLPIDHMEVARLAILGVVVGILVPLFALLIANYFIGPVFCRSADSFSVCSSGGVLAHHISAVIVGMMAVALLANWGVFRPLLVVVAVTIAMWGLQKYLGPMGSGNWTEYFAFSAALHGIGYVAFYWLLRLKSFPISVLLTGVGVVAACWAMVA